MLYTIKAKGFANANDIIHLCAYADDLAAAYGDFLIADKNARAGSALFYRDFDAIRTMLDWDAIKNNLWGDYYNPPPDTKAKKQAEFMVYRKVDWQHILHIGTKSEETAAKVRDILAKCGKDTQVTVKNKWYY